MGKSSLIKRFIQNTIAVEGPTIGPAEYRRQIYLNKSGQNINVEIWDVSG